MDKGMRDFYMNELRSRRTQPYGMANEELADAFFPYVKAEYPDAMLIKYGYHQYITVTERARTALISILAASKANHENFIIEIEKAVNQLKEGL